jgi:hypothetical protein
MRATLQSRAPLIQVPQMLRPFWAILVLFIAGNVLAAKAAGPLRVHPQNPRYFTDSAKNPDGSLRAVYLTGSHTWDSLHDCFPFRVLIGITRRRGGRATFSLFRCSPEDLERPKEWTTQTQRHGESKTLCVSAPRW